MKTIRATLDGLDRIEVQIGRDRHELTHTDARRLARFITDAVGADDAEPRNLAVRKPPTKGVREATDEQGHQFQEAMRARVRAATSDAEQRAIRDSVSYELHHRWQWTFADIAKLFGVAGTTISAGIDRHIATLPEGRDDL